MHSMNNQDYNAFLDKVIGSGVIDAITEEFEESQQMHPLEMMLYGQ